MVQGTLHMKEGKIEMPGVHDESVKEEQKNQKHNVLVSSCFDPGSTL